MRTLDLSQAAELLHLHPDTVQQRAKAGEIPAAKPGKCWVFVEADLIDWLRGHYHEGQKGKPCSVKEEISGGLISNTLEREFDVLVAPRTGRKRRNTTTVLRPSFGSKRS